MFGRMVNWIGCDFAPFNIPQRYKINPRIEYLCCMSGEWTSRHKTGGGVGGSWSSYNARLCRGWSESKLLVVPACP